MLPQQVSNDDAEENKAQQQQQEEEERTYSRADLEAFNLLDQPIWIFDIVRRAMWWANKAAIHLWSADSLESLLARNFAYDMSEATANRLDDYLVKFSKSKEAVIQDQWTYYPNGLGPKTVLVSQRGVCIEEGRIAMLCHGTYCKETTLHADQEALRSVEMLRHLPVSVCLTDLEGNVMKQNPEALAVFGSLENQSSTTSSNMNGENTDLDDEDEDDEEGASNTRKKRRCNSTFIKRFVDKEVGRYILEEAKRGNEVVSVEALQHTVHGARWFGIQTRQTKDPVTSEPILLHSAQDITAVVEAKRQAVEADVAKMDLLSNMGHAIRVPLQHVVGVVELINRQTSIGHTNKSEGSSSIADKQQQLVLPEEARFSTLLQSASQLLMTVIHDLMDSVGGGDRNTRNFDANHFSGPGRVDVDGDGFDSQPSSPRRNSTRILLEHSPFDVRNVLDGIVATIAPHAVAKKLSIKVHTQNFSQNSTAFSVMGDANRLGRVLFEILHNAVKHTSVGGIFVTLSKTSSRLRRVRLSFIVQDTGVGLNLEQQKVCMLPKKDKDSTQGVGLRMCKSIVEAMGGTIAVESKPGRGARFSIEIPFLRAPVCATRTDTNTPKTLPPKLEHRGGATRTDANIPKTLPPKSERRGGRKSLNGSFSRQGSRLDPVPDEGGLKILLVDQDGVGRNITRALLEQCGHDVTTTDHNEGMISAVSQDSFDVILLEIQLQQSEARRNMLDTVREIRTMGYSTETLPIIALTSAVPRADYPDLGLNDWLTKPVFIKDVQTAMTNAICNVGTTSVGTSSALDLESVTSSQDGNTIGVSFTRTSSGNNLFGDSCPCIPRRSSYESFQSTFSDRLEAVMSSPTCPSKVSTSCSEEEQRLLDMSSSGSQNSQEECPNHDDTLVID